MEPKSPWDDFRHVFHVLSVPVTPQPPTNPTPDPLSPHGRPSRWTPSTWASWSFSARLAWSSCWGRATPSVSCCGLSYNLSRSSSLSSCSEIPSLECRKVESFWQLLISGALLLSSPTGSSLRLSPHRDAFLHLRHHWHAGTSTWKED